MCTCTSVNKIPVDNINPVVLGRECAVGVNVGDGTTSLLKPVPFVVMDCIVLGRQMYVYLTGTCRNATIDV